MSIRYEDYETEDGLEDAQAHAGPDREISLGTTTVLGIFLGLALVCALFFGFGYSMGRRSVPSPLANVSTDVSAPLPENRLTPGSLPGSASGTYVPPTERSGDGGEGTTDPASGARAPRGQHTKPPAASPATETDSGASASVESVEREQVTKAIQQAAAPGAHTAVPASQAPAGTATPTAGNSFVQITAISPTHRADADMLVSSLRHKGYAAAIRTGATDDLLHVQLGPFPTRKDAEAVRQRLSIDGYNSILK